MKIHVQIRVVKMEVMSPICIHCHVGVLLDLYENGHQPFV